MLPSRGCPVRRARGLRRRHYERRDYLELERLWSEMAALAERFDREHDDMAKTQIYAMMEEVEQVRHRVA